ncbi:MAG: DUF2853 family protein, partial [Roseivirga sp.]|nr:DUF2853 family protein [Roseivirga sp.]
MACSDPEELKTVKESFLMGKLGSLDRPERAEEIEKEWKEKEKPNQ